MTVVGKEALQIDLVDTVLIFGKSDGAEQTVLGRFSFKGGVVNTAQINKIQRASAHDEHGFKVTALFVFHPIGNLCQIVQYAALVRQLELTDSDQLLVYRRRIGKQIGVVFDLAFQTDLLLTELGLNRKNF